MKTYIAAAKRQNYERHWTDNVALTPEAEGSSAISYLCSLTIDPTTVAADTMVSAVHHDRFVKTFEDWKFVKRTVSCSAAK